MLSSVYPNFLESSLWIAPLTPITWMNRGGYKPGSLTSLHWMQVWACLPSGGCIYQWGVGINKVLRSLFLLRFYNTNESLSEGCKVYEVGKLVRVTNVLILRLTQGDWGPKERF